MKINYNIIILDSGFGGLSIYKEIYKILPNIYYTYIFDNYAFPYGKKKEFFLINRFIKIIKKIQKIEPISLIVIACNSASTAILPLLKNKFFFPIIGVVPNIKKAVKVTKNKIIGLLATEGTIKREYTNKLIKVFANNCKVIKLGSSKLVKIAEDKIYGKKIFLDQIYNIIKPLILRKQYPDTIILGCTHFSLLEKELNKILKNVNLIDAKIEVSDIISSIIFKQKPLFISNNYNKVYYTKTIKNKKILKKIFNVFNVYKIKKITV